MVAFRRVEPTVRVEIMAQLEEGGQVGSPTEVLVG